jgi:uncharacterized delta-60 repeat protein
MRIVTLSVALFGLFLYSRSQSGTLDKAFGKNGIVETVLTGNGNTIPSYTRSCFISHDGKLELVVELGAQVVINRREINGKIDSGYGKNGFSVSVDMIQPLGAIQMDGKIVVAGASGYSNTDFVLARYNLNGSLDLSFGNRGVVITDIGSNNDLPNAILIQGDGKILVGGQSSRGGVPKFAIARYEKDGSLDKTFGNKGIVITDFGNSCIINSLAFQSDDKIIAAGNFFNGSNTDFAIARYKVNGSLDSSFNGNGESVSDFGNSENASSVAIQTNGKILVGGYFTDPAFISHFVLAQYNSNGSIDSSFGSAGTTTSDFGNSQNFLVAISLQANGKILAGGYTYVNNSPDFAIARFNENGGVDSSFGSNGGVVTDIDSSYDLMTCLTINREGKIIAGGTSNIIFNYNLSLARYNQDGRLDSLFGTGGKLVGYFPDKNINYSLGVVQKDGKLVASGQIYDGTTIQNFLSRFNKDGSADYSYGKKGVAITNGVNPVMQSDGKIVESGFLNTANGGSILMSRYNTNGSIDSSYGNTSTDISDFFFCN